MDTVHAMLSSVVFLYVLTTSGNMACRQMFILTGLKEKTDNAIPTAQRAGWVIGTLERLVLSIGILSHSWEVLAAVIALKTVARFKELDDQNFAEYFLAGSLFSILWAVTITTAWVTYDRTLGIGLFEYLSTTLSEVKALTPAP
jgi:hypothetical protein